MLVTLFTDAGFCPHTKLATWAVWAKAEGRTLRRSGILRGTLADQHVAELRALVNGVALVVAWVPPGTCTAIVANTDSAAAIAALTGTGFRRPEAWKRVAHAIEAMRERTAAAGVRVEYRHVRAHQGNSSPRSAVNEWCDGECRRQLRLARDLYVRRRGALPQPLARVSMIPMLPSAQCGRPA